MIDMKVKVLEVCAKLNIGGAQLVGANIAKYAREDHWFCYVVFGDEVGEYEQEILARGNQIVHMPSPQNGSLRFFRNLVRLMRREKFDVVHCHTMYSGGLVMLAALLAGVPGRICHSHTAKDSARQTLQRKLYKGTMRFLIRHCSTDFWACGVDAGRELYGTKWFDRYGTVIQNGIAYDGFLYQEKNAEEIRQRYGLEGKRVLGHVGHYVEVKNQSFLIGLMPEVLKRMPNSILLLFGDGEDREKLSAQIRERGLEQSVRLMGNVSDICKVLSAFDLFVFPSLFEGTPLALIEAQANGLPCLISDNVPGDACRTDLIHRCSLVDTEGWIAGMTTLKRAPDTSAPQKLMEQYESVERAMENMYRVFDSYAGKKESKV